jgi:hypothetical protein
MAQQVVRQHQVTGLAADLLRLRQPDGRPLSLLSLIGKDYRG